MVRPRLNLVLFCLNKERKTKSDATNQTRRPFISGPPFIFGRHVWLTHRRDASSAPINDSNGAGQKVSCWLGTNNRRLAGQGVDCNKKILPSSLSAISINKMFCWTYSSLTRSDGTLDLRNFGDGCCQTATEKVSTSAKKMSSCLSLSC